jgi:hypothetical protein
MDDNDRMGLYHYRTKNSDEVGGSPMKVDAPSQTPNDGRLH